MLGRSPCMKLSIFFFLLFVINAALSPTCVKVHNENDPERYIQLTSVPVPAMPPVGDHHLEYQHRTPQAIVQQFVSTVSNLCCIGLVFLVRQAVRKKYGIPAEDYCFSTCFEGFHEKAFVEDAVCSCCCMPCVVAQ